MIEVKLIIIEVKLAMIEVKLAMIEGNKRCAKYELENSFHQDFNDETFPVEEDNILSR